MTSVETHHHYTLFQTSLSRSTAPAPPSTEAYITKRVIRSNPDFLSSLLWYSSAQSFYSDRSQSARERLQAVQRLAEEVDIESARAREDLVGNQVELLGVRGETDSDGDYFRHLDMLENVIHRECTLRVELVEHAERGEKLAKAGINEFLRWNSTASRDEEVEKKKGAKKLADLVRGKLKEMC